MSSFVYKCKHFIRDNESSMMILSIIYRWFGFNRFKGKRGIKISWSGVFAKRVSIENYGVNNTLEIAKGCRLNNCKVQFFGDGNKVIISNDCVFNEVDIWISDGSVIEVGHNTHFTGKIHIACIEGKTIRIGARCLFSNEITLRTGDSHSILNSKGERINQAADIRIGDHVWVGQQVVILKGAGISSESIIGTRALVTGKEFESNVIIAGIPARVINSGVTWHHDLK